MTTITIPTKPLRTALSVLTPIAKTLAANPIAGMFRIGCDESKLHIEANNLEEYCEMIVEAEVEQCAEFLVNAPKFSTAIQFAKLDEVVLELDGDVLTIRSGGVTTLKTRDAAAFPSPKLSEFNEIGCETKDFAAALRRVKWVTPNKTEARAFAQCVHAFTRNATIECEATSGYAYAWASQATISGDFNQMIPLKHATSICEALERDGASVSFSDRAVMVRHAQGLQTWQKLDAQWPSLAENMKSTPKTLLGSVDAEQFNAELSATAAMLTDQNDSIILTLSDDGLEMVTQCMMATDAVYRTSLSGKFQPAKKRFGSRHLTEAASEFKDGNLDIYACEQGLRLEGGSLTVMLHQRTEK